VDYISIALICASPKAMQMQSEREWGSAAAPQTSLPLKGASPLPSLSPWIIFICSGVEVEKQRVEVKSRGLQKFREVQYKVAGNYIRGDKSREGKEIFRFSGIIGHLASSRSVV